MWKWLGCSKNSDRLERGTSRLILGKSLEKLFKDIDKDKDGKISKGELASFLKKNQNNLSDEAIEEIYKNADEDADGQITLSELKHMLSDPEKRLIFKKYLKRYFKVIMPNRYSSLYRYWPPPFCMILVSFSQLLVFCVDAYYGNTTATGPVARYLIYDPSKKLQLWRYLTYTFGHVGYPHLIMNLLIQTFLGMPIEMANRWWRVLIIYLAGVLGGSLGTSVFTPSVKIAGSSGGVYSLITGHVAIVILNWNDMDYPLTNLLIFCAFTIANIEHIPSDNKHNNLSHSTHVSGALAGLLVGITILRNVNISKWEKNLQKLALVTYIILITVCITWNIATYKCESN